MGSELHAYQVRSGQWFFREVVKEPTQLAADTPSYMPHNEQLSMPAPAEPKQDNNEEIHRLTLDKKNVQKKLRKAFAEYQFYKQIKT